MTSIAYIGSRTALESPMGLILPLALIAAVLLLMTVWKDTSAGISTKSFLVGGLYALAAVWAIVWMGAAHDYTERSTEAAEAAVQTMNSAYGVELSAEDAMDIVQDRTREGFIAQSAEGRIVLDAVWEDESLVLYSTGYEAANLQRVER